ncbi:MAG: beta/gamma crystallin domain-containing protein [Methylovulum miyakonense]|uniref:beta/gamma crystallin domain-containing protein n=1 Tax=Methylovulum miyakonense TaxID=645578 RepID=UPI003BB53FCE
MKSTQFISRTFKTVAMAVALLGSVSTSYAKDKDCWAEFFQESQYGGEHFRLEGAVQLENLTNVQGENWASRIDSLKVGPKATVTVFENTNFKLTLKEMAKYPDLLRSLGLTEKDVLEDSELIFRPNSVIHDLSDFNFHHKVKSLKVECNK